MRFDYDRVEVSGLTKVYGATRALSSVSARFDAGRVTVVEGPNGSGKTTLINVIGGSVRPTRGTVRYGGRAAKKIRTLRATIGVLAHAPMIYPDLNARQNLRFYLELHSIAPTEEILRTLEERFEIGRFGARPARTYSRGQLQRVALARALLHRPRLLLLDEPSTGLDRRTVERLVDAVTEERDRGAIVVLITHDAAFADRLADDRVRLARGRVLAPQQSSGAAT